MGPRYNEGPKDWQNVYVTTKFLYIRVFFFFFYYWGKENCSLFREPRSREVHYIEIPLCLNSRFWRGSTDFV